MFEEINNATEKPMEFPVWGECTVTAFKAYRDSWGNQNPVAFDANIHSSAKAAWRVEILVIALDEMNSRYPRMEQKFWADSHDFAVTLKSVKDLDPRGMDAVHNHYVETVRRANGGKYAVKDKATGQLTGEMKDKTDLLFLKVFQSQDECLSDYLGTSAGDPVTEASADAFPVDAQSAAQTVSQPAGAPPALVMQFAQALVTGAVTKLGKDPAAVMENVRVQIESSPFFGGKKLAELPEVMELIMKAVA